VLVAGAAVVLLAWWLRDPLIPYGGETPGASGISSDSTPPDEPLRKREQALAAMADAIRSKQAELGVIAASALEAPARPADAFEFLERLPKSPDAGVMIVDNGEPAAWAGQMRSPPSRTGPGTAVSFSEFYVTLQVVLDRNDRRAIATSLIYAAPPADGVAASLDATLAERPLVASFRFGAVADTSVGIVVTGQTGYPLLRVDATPLAAEQLRFAAAFTARGRGVVLLAVVMFFIIALGWSDRRWIGVRLFTVAAAIAAVALIPWNIFSNFSRAFDPAYYYSPFLGPLTATAGAYLMSAAFAVLAVIAVIRSRRTNINRIVAGVLAVAFLVAGPAIARSTAAGISLPPWGSTPALWLQWQIPLFLVLLASWLAAAWLGKIAMNRKPMVKLRAAGFIAVLAGSVATFIVWNITTEQRLQLAMRDVAGLERADADAGFLLARFGDELASYETPGTRADLLKRYAVSDLAAAQVQVSLSLWSADGSRYGTLDLAPLRYDTVALTQMVRETSADAVPAVRPEMGPAGRKLTLVVAHRGGGFTTVVASPRTRLVAQDPYAALLGFEQPEQTEPPYVLTLADVTPRASIRADTMTWRRLGSEWHGDEIIETSGGPARAHVEVDLRTWSTRLVRASLVVIFNVVVAAILWAFSAMAEGGFLRWARGRASRWARSYRGRLTLALFTFFVVPAIAFAGWSYQRLRGDDREVRELLVRESLNAAAEENPASSRLEYVAGETPLFRYSRATLTAASDSLYEMIAPAGRMLPADVHMSIAHRGELTASWQQTISNSTIFWGYRAAASALRETYVLAAPARRDEIVLDRRRRDLTMLVLFATAVGGIAAFWLSGIAARVLARDLELSRLEVARAERVLAWGEMARQVAHEIKNPLTPIRLGVQHLRRARADTRIDFDRVLDENVTRILAEIDRLDEIARAFSRYGSAPADLPPAETVDVAAILRDVVGLEKMGIGGVTWSLQGATDAILAEARAEELRDVLLNVFENSRLARARNVEVTLSQADRHVKIHITDDGSGISPAALPRVFEPHFSTRTTGSGLGLAISRRLLESWGGRIDLESEEGSGARVVITLNAPRS
jgi:signal transduction histidine kinase